ncbi:hypothetical protein Harreka1_6 [Olleya phage Harreka_1]|uniref:Uncharacterized protein n=1 Tax=Olleya phage Harreka_1 TaxID=2745673 RepID=A0A8E5E9G3_9CAUD|nr:hypothetical protein M1M26_gp06 [Olleya phage Harreka_1]QQV90413.1 hypothetical protein Harreka1_6 [Olleya phage Harreka_1]
MSNCFSCGKGFKGDVNELLRIYKEQYDTKGIERYFYRLETNGTLFTCTKSSFLSIFNSQIKPNFENGSEYAHIKEYGLKT